MDILNNFGIQPTLLLAQIVNFLIILLLLKRFFFKPILKVLEDRKKRIEESIKNADLIEQKLQETNEETSKILDEAQKRAQGLINEAKEHSSRIAQEASAEARKTIESALASARDQIAVERQKMQKELEKETVTLVSGVVKKLLSRSLRQDERKILTSKSISEIARR